MTSAVRRGRTGHRPARRNRRRWPALVVVVAAVAVTAAVVYAVAPKGGGGPDPKAWDRKASAAFRELVTDVPELAKGAREWLAGERSTERFRAEVDADLTDFMRTRERVAALEPAPKAPEAGQLYEHSAQLYVEVARVYAVMVRSEDVALRPQLDLLARRVRELGDRVFDRGRAALAPYLGEASSEDVEVNLPEEVPIWPAEGLAPGPPLDGPPPPPSQYPPLRQADRPEESPSAWARDVRAAGIPSYRELTLAIAPVADQRDPRPPLSGPAVDRLRELAQRFVDAGEHLRSRPDPKGERERSAVLRLGLLVEADAARAAQAATFLAGSPQSGLARVAASIARIGDELVREGRP